MMTDVMSVALLNNDVRTWVLCDEALFISDKRQ